ncbi:hypothetical protein LMB49_10920 [Limosilactobacillus reuteri]|uniref:hypothetical protein n=1 Tax=Limosilactobacillus reuteri TaxID=1598 RepID=UPI001E5851CC|nr:hypothetical protein [Limosilactobacillus reuteri]MCC4371902.1 hypothetical protein [Limosilactobacillus reuteri]MCC4509637.1 hypothetical protein [Limosilactobacillus reuteri]
MSSCITSDLAAATYSLNYEGYFKERDLLNKSIEDLLKPDDWRLKAIHEFRQRLNLAEIYDQIKSANRLYFFFMKNKVINPYSQAYIMFMHGAKVHDIERVTGLSKKTIGRNPVSSKLRVGKGAGNDIRTIELLITSIDSDRLRGLAQLGEQMMKYQT